MLYLMKLLKGKIMIKKIEEKIEGVIESLGYLFYDVSLVKENE